MEFKDHSGPVYALHRVFRLDDVDWPRAEVREEERERGLREEPLSHAALTRKIAAHTGG
jgi:hypothetical protein